MRPQLNCVVQSKTRFLKKYLYINVALLTLDIIVSCGWVKLYHPLKIPVTTKYSYTWNISWCHKVDDTFKPDIGTNVGKSSSRFLCRLNLETSCTVSRIALDKLIQYSISDWAIPETKLTVRLDSPKHVCLNRDLVFS